MSRLLMLAVLSAAPAIAQEAPEGEPGAPPTRVRSVLLYGDDTCPKAEGPDEVVVCAKAGESPYRIPKSLRKTEPGPGGTSWVRRAELVDEVNRQVLPGSCSPIGSYGQSGCTIRMLQQWKAEQRAKKEEEAAIPGGDDD
ncbi:hypothetical protein FPZ54_05325 [Sphingomonas suaedae]|uniref:DUF4124 domain-containing protein n=1 Tax=Sphingomonas suaedae TaxID=2599297 RepID=A0A518RDN5_9SPHN|nr:hypothetical protein [Sphingomonas suaedae]QDX25501.1 hypothetical protein FPZ54_05325 [Sphingomonas suaedae]